MRPGTAVQAAPTRPQVNLLPAEVREARSLGIVKRWMVASFGVTAIAVGTVAAVGHVQTQTAEAELAQVEAETARLLVQQRPFLEVTALRTELDTVRTARAYALAGEILWSDYLGALAAVTPDGVRISSVDHTATTPLAATPASTDPLVGTGVGVLTFAAVARDVPDTAAWADALDAVPGFSDARIQAVVLADDGPAGDLVYDVTGTVRLDPTAYSHRFNPLPDALPEGDS